MQRNDSEKRERFAFARTIELAVASHLMTKGWSILPVYDCSGQQDDKAPRLHAFSASDSVVLPDLLLARGGLMRWVEVKFKTEAPKTHCTGYYETGISVRHWEHYHRAEKESGAVVFISFAHQTEDVVTCNSLRELRTLWPQKYPRYSPNGPDPGGSLFWPLEKLRRVAALSEILSPAEGLSASIR